MTPDAHCPGCGHDVPQGRFCVRCGTSLSGAGDRSRGAAEFAAAPNERLSVPRLVSSVFPQLPRAEMSSFRIGLAIGVAVVVALTVLRLFGVAVAAAALLVPVLTVVYLYEVDVYEDEPVLVVLLTMGWGALAGVAVALVSQGVAPAGADIFSGPGSSGLLVQAILLPLAGVVVVLAGPLVLLRHPRFNDVLDGVTFGAAAAVSFVAASALTFAVWLFQAGLQPDGAVVQWVFRVLTIAVAGPVLSMAAVGAATGALWLRYRAPVADRAALGVLGSPAVAIPLAAAAVVLGALGQRLLPYGLWLVELLILDALALVWLRRAIHLGLLQEAREIEIGPAIRCANCGETTARHSFCSNCGISLQALPKERRPAPPASTAPGPAETGG